MSTLLLPSPSTNGHAPALPIPDSRTSTPNLPFPHSNGGRIKEGGGDRGQTGPKTLAGKSFSRANAVKHGDNATDDVFLASLSDDERHGFQKIRRSLRRFYEPANSYERLLVDRMAIQHLRMLRLYRLESITMRLLPINKGSDHSIFPHLDRFSRYDVRIEKQLRILHNRLLRLGLMRENNTLNPLPTNE